MRLYSRALVPLIPPAPFSHKGRRGSLGVLVPETGDGTQGLAKTSTPVSIPPAPFPHTGLKGGGFAGRLSTVSVPPNARADPSVS